MKIFSTKKKEGPVNTAWDSVEKQLTSSSLSLGVAAFYLGAGIAVGVAAFLCPEAAMNTAVTMKKIATTMCLVAPIEFAVSHWKLGKVKKQLKKMYVHTRELDSMKGIEGLRKECFLTNAWGAVEAQVIFKRAAVAATGLMAGFSVGSVAAQFFGVALAPCWDKMVTIRESLGCLSGNLLGSAGAAVAGAVVVGGVLYKKASDLGGLVKANLQKVAVKKVPVVKPVVERSRPAYSSAPAAQVLAR